jgi:RND family efflux transporter MFP subunit
MNSKFKVLMIVMLIITLGSVGTMTFMLTHKEHGAETTPSKKQMYHCPMHPSYISDKPGDCPICAMKLVPINMDEHDQATEEKSSGERKILYYRDAMHPSITSDKPGKASDGMDLVPVYEDAGGNDGSGIKIDPTTVQNMGVTTTPVEVRNLKKEIRTSVTLENSETGVFIVNTKIMGYVEKLFIDFTGQSVKKGQPLLTMYSPDLVSTQEEYLQAIRYANGLPASSQIARDGALSLVESAKRRLLNWDISEAQIETLGKRGTPEKSMTIYAPATGIVLEKMVVAGQNIEPGMPLYKIADLSRIWAMANVYQEDLPFIKIGMTADVELTSIPGKTFKGKVQFISPVLDMNSKTAQVRIEIPNTSDYALKPQMFASVKLVSSMPNIGIAIPEQSIIHSGTRNIVVIALGNGYFKPQEIRLGTTADGYVQVLEGLKEGQTIVTSSQFLIDSESNLRAAVNKMTGSDSTGEQKAPENDNKMKNMPGMSMDNKSVDNVAATPASMEDMEMSQSGQKKQINSNTQSNDNKVVPTKDTLSYSVVYICPMDKDVVSDKPGRCPKCGMNLVKKGD